MNECLVASTSKTGPVVHGVENFHGGRFWALANNSDSDSDVEQTNVLPKTRQLHGSMLTGLGQQLAPPVSSVVPQYFPAGSILSPVLSTASGHRSVGSFSSLMLESAQKRNDQRPWQGRIPAPRVSPCLTMGDAISRARIIQKKANSWPRSGITKIHSSLDQRQPSTVIRKEFQNSSNGRILRHNAGCVDGPASSVSRTMKLDPRMPYRPPTVGLVSLFARTGTNIGASRAPIAREHSANKSSVAPLSFAASYTQVAARSMEGGIAKERLGGEVHRKATVVALLARGSSWGVMGTGGRSVLSMAIVAASIRLGEADPIPSWLVFLLVRVVAFLELELHCIRGQYPGWQGPQSAGLFAISLGCAEIGWGSCSLH
jgi:hypothetical protein